MGFLSSLNKARKKLKSIDPLDKYHPHNVELRKHKEVLAKLAGSPDTTNANTISSSRVQTQGRQQGLKYGTEKETVLSPDSPGAVAAAEAAAAKIKYTDIDWTKGPPDWSKVDWTGFDYGRITF